MNKLLFLCVSLTILLFSIIVTNVAPIIKKKVGTNWSYYACGLYSDQYKYAEDSVKGLSSELKDKRLNPIKKEKTRCNRRKAMNGLEYVVSNLNIIFGFVCAFAGFLLYFNIGNLGNDGKFIGLIGLGCGVVGFVLTLVYVIESGIVFTDVVGNLKDLNSNYYYSYQIKIDSDGAYLKWNDSKKRYECIFYKKDNEDSLFLKYSDYGNKYLNYIKDIHFDDKKKKQYDECSKQISNSDLYDDCNVLSTESDDEIKNTYRHLKNYIINKISYNDINGNALECNKIYYGYDYENNDLKVIYDYWITSLIFSCFIMVLHIVLALFGFLLFREPGGSGSPVPNK